MFERAIAVGGSYRRNVSDPIELQQHVCSGNAGDSEEGRAPTEGGDDPTREYGADGAADAVGDRNEAGADAAAVRQQIGRGRVERRGRKTVTHPREREKKEKQAWVTADSGQAETESEKAQPGNQHRLASYPIRQATRETARQRRDDHHHREQAPAATVEREKAWRI